MGPTQIVLVCRDVAYLKQKPLRAPSESLTEPDVPLLLPASLNAASVLMMPNTSCVKAVTIFPCEGSGL